MSSRRDRSADAPLLAWGESMRTRNQHRLRRGWRIAITAAGVGVLLASAALTPAPRLLWNTSASAPIGLYWVSPGAWLERGDMAIARVPEPYRQLASERRYLPPDVPLVKRVAAYGGDLVCADGDRIIVNGRAAARRQERDSKGRPMPRWSGCVRLHGRDVFLLMNSPNSFDGRYFGATKRTDIVGRARLLWPR
jgi:conjugative transfer signal peptidase TraF